MATILAFQNGNWSATSSWIGNVVPTAGDNVYLNGKIIVVDVNITCASISSRAESGSLVQGSLTVTGSRTINANLIHGSSSDGNTLLTLSTAGITVNITGNVEGSNSGGANVRCIAITAACTTNITGNVIAGSLSTNSRAIEINAVTGGTTNIVGDITTSRGYGILIAASSNTTVNVTGNVYGNTSNNNIPAIDNGTVSTVNITGNCFGGTGTAGAPNTAAAYNSSTGLIRIIGTATGGPQGSAGAYNNSTGTIWLKRAKGNDGGPGQQAPTTTTAAGLVNNNVQAICFVEEIEYGLNGATPVTGPVRFKDVVTNSCIAPLSTSGTKTLSDPNNTAGLVPAVSDVRKGVVYANGVNTGTCNVPASSSVAAGVLVDNTVGTAVLTISSISNVVAQLLADTMSSNN